MGPGFNRILLALLVVTFHNLSIAQESSTGPDRNMPTAAAYLTGKVLSSSGKPVVGIRVEIDDGATAIPTSSTYTTQGGLFYVHNLTPGRYEVVAEDQEAADRENIVLDSSGSTVQLRLHPPATSSSDLAPIVSVAQMVVPTRALNLYAKAAKQFKDGQYGEKTLKLLDEALGIDPEFAQALTLKGLLKTQESTTDQAQQYLESAIRIDPTQVAAHVALAAIYNHAGRFSDALQESRRAVTLAPTSWQGHFEMAKATLALHSPIEALKLLRRTEELGGGKFSGVHLMKAYCLLTLGLQEDAKYQLHLSLSHHPTQLLESQARQVLASMPRLSYPDTQLSGLPK
jgi:tetratricopeptide (TPR) repeat protein